MSPRIRRRPSASTMHLRRNPSVPPRSATTCPSIPSRRSVCWIRTFINKEWEMKRKTFIISGAVAALALILVAAQTFGNSDLAKIRRATANFHRTEAAQAAGYDLRPGLDHCFDNPGVGGMGFHYIDAAALDTKVDLLHPEAMIYIPSPDGLQLCTVEYIVPQDKWDATGSTEPPMLN